MTVEYKPYPKGFYHVYSLKSLTRLRDSVVRQRSFYMVKLTNLLDHTLPDGDYDEIRRISRGKFSFAQLISLRELASKTVGESNFIFDIQLRSILTLYKTEDTEVAQLENEIVPLISELNPHMLTIPGIGPITAAVIASEYGDFSLFSSPSQMLSFAGLEPGYYQSGTLEFRGKMVKRGSLQFRYVLMNCVVPLIRFDPVFASYYHKKRTEGKPSV